MRKMKCPVCASEVPGTALRSGTFPCPTCQQRLHVREPSTLLTIPFAGCGYFLTYLTGHLMGLKGNALFLVTFFVGIPATFVVGAVTGALSVWVFCHPLPLERDPDPGSEDGRILHIESPPTPPEGPQ